MENSASFRFYSSLNDFLPPRRKNSWISYGFSGKPAVKDAIEALGVPHPEIEVILVNGSAVDFKHALHPQEQVEVYPADLLCAYPASSSLREKRNGPESFILDVHLGKLAKSLRMLGFDCRYENQQEDKEIAEIAELENRIVLSRDVGLLKHRNVGRGYWLRSQMPQEQLEEVIKYFNLENEFKPFTRCLACNGLIEEVPKECVQEQLPPKTRQYFNEYFQCSSCSQVYWKGSHYERMQEFVNKMAPFIT